MNLKTRSWKGLPNRQFDESNGSTENSSMIPGFHDQSNCDWPQMINSGAKNFKRQQHIAQRFCAAPIEPTLPCHQPVMNMPMVTIPACLLPTLRQRNDKIIEERRLQKKLEAHKTIQCQAWLDTGRCNFGARCKFAHGDIELKKSSEEQQKVLVNPRYRTTLCLKYFYLGGCPYGDRCCYIHEPSDSIDLEKCLENLSALQNEPSSPDPGSSIAVADASELYGGNSQAELLPGVIPQQCLKNELARIRVNEKHQSRLPNPSPVNHLKENSVDHGGWPIPSDKSYDRFWENLDQSLISFPFADFDGKESSIITEKKSLLQTAFSDPHSSTTDCYQLIIADSTDRGDSQSKRIKGNIAYNVFNNQSTCMNDEPFVPNDPGDLLHSAATKSLPTACDDVENKNFDQLNESDRQTIRLAEVCDEIKNLLDDSGENAEKLSPEFRPSVPNDPFRTSNFDKEDIMLPDLHSLRSIWNQLSPSSPSIW